MGKPKHISEWDNKTLNDIDVLARKEGIYLFIGAGLSATIGYLTGAQLVSALFETIIQNNKSLTPEYIKDFEKTIKKKADILSCLNLIKEKNDRLFKNKMLGSFCQKNPQNYSPLHQSLVSIVGLKGIITTNYDLCLEDALSSLRKQFVLVESVEGLSSGSSLPIYHIHGSTKDYNKMIVTGHDYHALYTDDFNVQIRQFLSNNIIIYVGYGFNDDELKRILEQKAILEKTSKGQNKDHFAIYSYSGSKPSQIDEEIFFKDKGIRIQYYYRNKDFDYFNNIIEELSGRLTSLMQYSESAPTEVK